MSESEKIRGSNGAKKCSKSASYKATASIYRNFKEEQTEQKQRGLNDYNLFTTLLKKTDEVRLHSRFIASLLDPKGLHYQDSLFLEIFLSLYKPANFNFNSKSASVFREYENIDLYLTDGNNHIIIENKIYAGDQKAQIERYVETIQKHESLDNFEDEEMNIWVVYLTIDRDSPSEYSLGSYRLNTNLDELHNDFHRVFYSNLHYTVNSPNRIVDWLKKCLEEVKNLQDLSFSIKQYIEVVEKLTGIYRSKVMTLKEFIDGLSADERQDFLITATEISKEIPDVKSQHIEIFFEKLESKLSDYLPDGWSVECNPKNLHKRCGYPFRICNHDNAFWIALEFKNDEYKTITIGVVRKNRSINIAQAISNENVLQQLEPLKSKYKKLPHNGWWLTYEDIKIDLWAEIIKRGEEPTLDLLTNRLKQLVHDFAAICDLTNTGRKTATVKEHDQ